MSFRTTLGQFIRRILRQRPPSPDPTPPEPSSSQMIQGLMRALELTEEGDCSCEETFELLDQYAERLNNGEDVARVMPLIKRHLDLCRDCREEFEALLQVLRAKAGDA